MRPLRGDKRGDVLAASTDLCHVILPDILNVPEVVFDQHNIATDATSSKRLRHHPQ